MVIEPAYSLWSDPISRLHDFDLAQFHSSVLFDKLNLGERMTYCIFYDFLTKFACYGLQIDCRIAWRTELDFVELRGVNWIIGDLRLLRIFEHHMWPDEYPK